MVMLLPKWNITRYLLRSITNPITRIIASPGVLMQHITTKEPDEKMIEVAIQAMKDVIPENGEDRIG